jgi:glyoxalase/bleomycin resistance protein/dioxygenase superfamily protein
VRGRTRKSLVTWIPGDTDIAGTFSDPGAFTTLGFFGPKKNTGASAAYAADRASSRHASSRPLTKIQDEETITINRSAGRARTTKIGAGKIEVLFVAGFGPIVREMTTSRKLYGEALGIPFKEESGGYLHTEALQGAKTFALWPLSQAAHSCFGNDSWPEDIPFPQAWLEFDVQSVESATAALESQGYRILVKNKKEPWGQTVTRLLSPEGLLVGITFTPLMRKEK